MRRRRPPVLALIVLVLGLAGCADTSDEPGAADPGGADGPVLVIEGFAFHPTPVAAGSTVTVDNRDQAAHSVTGEDFDVRVGGGSTGSFAAPDSPGAYEFSCTLHPAMTATLTVE